MKFTTTNYVRPKVKIPRKRLKELISQMKGRCGYCGINVVYPKKGNTHDVGYEKSIIATTDHIIPLNKGGEHIPCNMICCCFRCNSQKINRDLEDFRVYLFHRLTNTPLFSPEQMGWLEISGFVFPVRYVSFFFEREGFFYSPETGLQEPT